MSGMHAFRNKKLQFISVISIRYIIFLRKKIKNKNDSFQISISPELMATGLLA